MQVESFRDTNELANFCANVDVKSVFQEVEVHTNHGGLGGTDFWTENFYKYVVFYEDKVKPVEPPGVRDVINKMVDELAMQNDKIIDLSRRTADLEKKVK